MTLIQKQSGTSPSDVADDHTLRSQFMERLIAETERRSCTDGHSVPPRLLVQFWDAATLVPSDVQRCLDSWAPLEDSGFKRLLFDDVSAAQFIRENFGPLHARAFKRCHHPAMRADYFRLCFIMKVGGFYVDADDIYQGLSVEELLVDGCLKLQPLCYDVATDSMVDPVSSAQSEGAEGRIFYVNNNPLIAPPEHPVIARALEQATSSLLSADESSRDIQSLTGPGNLTACLVIHAIETRQANVADGFELLSDWGSIAISEWSLEYRSDHRNWRHWVHGDG